MRTLKQVATNMADAFTRFGLWKGGGSGGSSALSEMTDVTFTNLQPNDVLTYNGSKWVNDDNLQTQINTLNSNLGKHKYVVGARGGIIPASTNTGWHTVTLTFTNMETLEAAIAMQKYTNQSQKAIVLTNLSGNQAEFGYYGTLSTDLNIIAIGIGISK